MLNTLGCSLATKHRALHELIYPFQEAILLLYGQPHMLLDHLNSLGISASRGGTKYRPLNMRQNAASQRCAASFLQIFSNLVSKVIPLAWYVYISYVSIHSDFSDTN